MLRASGALTRFTRRTFSLRQARSNPLLKKSHDFARSFAFFRASLAVQPRFWTIRPSPGEVFGSQNDDLSRFFGARARSLLTSSEVYKTLAGAILLALRSFRAMSQNRQNFVPRAFSTARAVTNTLGQRSGAFPHRPERGSMGSWTLPGRSWTAPWPPKSAPEATFSRPGTVPRVPWRVSKPPLRAPNHPRPLFRRFVLDFGRFFFDVRGFFHRCSLDIRTTFALCLLLFL